MKTKYPKLNNTEFKVCIFSFLPLSIVEIADLLRQSKSTVGKARTKIRKKIGLKESGGDFCEYIIKNIE